MLTRIEVDGFKNLLGFSAEFGPFTCIAGPNAVGKSNLFDAIEFLSLLAEYPLEDAAKRIRGAERGIRDLFWTDGHTRADTMSFAVELALPASVQDEFGATVEMCTNLVRYEVRLRYLPPDELPTTERRLTSVLRVVHESLSAISSSQYQAKVRFPQRETLLIPRFADASHEELGGATGALPRTTVSVSSTASEAEWLAVRQELRSWRRVTLQPDAIREVATFDQIDEPMAADGSGLTATIYRLAHTGTSDPEAVYAELASWLSSMTPVERLSVDRDDKNRRLTLEVETKRDGLLPAAALSDGSLRFLALACLAHEARPGLLCIDEAENGVHPSAIDDLVVLLHRLASHTRDDVEDAGGLQQVIINTHSPNVVRSVHQHDPAELLIARTVATLGPSGAEAWALRLRPLVGTWRDDPQSPGVGIASITPLPGFSPNMTTRIRFALIGEGPSDRPLVGILHSLCREIMPSADVDSEWANPTLELLETGKELGAQLRALANYEAWLLLDETAIRKHAGNPNGRQPLGLPKPKHVEQRANPKELLREALIRACTPGRQQRELRSGNEDFGRIRRRLFDDLDIHGPVTQLSAWQALVEDTKAALTALSRPHPT